MYDNPVTTNRHALNGNEPKNRRKVANHGLPVETAISVFDDPHALSVSIELSTMGEHWQKVGQIDSVVILVARTWWEDDGEDVSFDG